MKSKEKAKNNKGKLIAIEGIDCSGKTTIAKLLVEKLLERGNDALYLKEPTRQTVASKIIDQYDYLSDDPNTQYILATLFTMDRHHDVMHNILPALEQGKIVVMDRYYLSTLAYSGSLPADAEYSGTIDGYCDAFNRDTFTVRWRKLLFRNRLFAPDPDITFLLLVTEEELKKRLKERGESEDVSRLLDLQKRYQDISLEISPDCGMIFPTWGEEHERDPIVMAENMIKLISVLTEFRTSSSTNQNLFFY